MKVKRALISVADKTDLAEFAKGLRDLGVEILSTGGTADFLEREGVEVGRLSEEVGASEMLGGRVKTLYPGVHAGILASRDSEDHMDELEGLGVEPVDLVVVNLYPFEESAGRGDEIDRAVENIDIGGVALIRSAAKNYRDVGILTDTGDYGDVLEELEDNDRRLGEWTRERLAVKAFRRTSDYDGAISDHFEGEFSGG